MRLHPIVLTFSVLTAIAAAPDFADAQSAGKSPAVSQPTGASQSADLANIETYLNGLTTAQSEFTFVGPDGSATHGIFSLSRPSKLRFEYTEPKGNLLIADGSFVIFYDAQQKEASNLPIGSTPLEFLLKPKISLTDGVKVTAFEHNAGVIRATLTPIKNDGEGSVTVAFSDQPLELRGWRLIDGQGQITDVSFSNWKFGMALDAGLFHYDSPRQGKRGR